MCTYLVPGCYGGLGAGVVRGSLLGGAGSAGLLRCPLCLLVGCSGGEGGTVCSSIWLFIEEAGVVGFVMFERGLPCACVRFVCRGGCGCGVVMGFAFRREPEYSAMRLVWEGICMVRSLGVWGCLPGLRLRFICGLGWGSLFEGQILRRFHCGVCCVAHCKFCQFHFGCGFVAR